MQSIEQFLDHLRCLGVNLRADGENLRCTAPGGVLNPDLRAELAKRKPEILSFLHNVAESSECRQEGTFFKYSTGIIQYTEEHNRFRERLHSFLEKEVIPYTAKWEEDRIVPKSVWKKMGKEGFLCTAVSPEYGGIGGDFLYSLIVAEEIAETDFMGLSASLHSDIVVPYITDYASEELRQKYLPGCVSGDIVTAVAITEPDAGSDISAIATAAVENGDEVVINGSKTFISNGINSDLVVLAARDPFAETASLSVSLYLAEAGTPGFSRGKQLKKMGQHSQDTAELFFSDCRIPQKNRLGKKGMGLNMLMEKLQQERLICVITAVSMAEQILKTTLTHYRQTSARGYSCSKSQAVQFALAEMATEIRIGRIFLEKLVADHIKKKNIVIEISMAKYWTSEMARRTADRCLDIFGQSGMLEKCPVVRRWRDVRPISIYAGTNEIMKNIIAEGL